jgi:hypothetical protein
LKGLFDLFLRLLKAIPSLFRRDELIRLYANAPKTAMTSG